MAKTNVKKNYFWNLLYTISSVVMPLITTPFLARTLGSVAIGTNSYVNSIASYFVIFCVLGTSMYGQRQIAYYSDKPEERSRNFYEIFIFRATTTFISLVAYAFFYFFIFKDDKTIFAIYAISLVNVIVDIAWFFQGMENFKSISIRNFIIRLVHTVFIFVVIRKPEDLWLYVLSSALCTILGNLSLWITVFKQLVRVDHIRPFRNTKDILLLFLPTIASQAYMLLDKSMIQWITNDKSQVGCYEESDKMIRVAMSLIESTSVVIMSKIANLYKEKQYDSMNIYFYKAFSFASFLAFPLMLGFIAITKSLVPIFWGSDFEYNYYLLPILSAIIPLSSFAYIIGYSYLVPVGKQHIYTLFVTITSIANVLLNLVFIYLLGVVGAAIGSVLGETILLLLELIYCKKKRLLELNKLLKSMIKYVISSLIMFGVVFTITYFYNGTIFALFVGVIAGIVIYTACLLIMRDDLFFEIIKTIVRKFKPTNSNQDQE